MTINLTISRSTTPNNILALLNNYNNSGTLNIILNFSRNGFIKASVYMVLTAYINELKLKGHIVNTTLSNYNQCTQLNYASRVNFFKHIGIEYPEHFVRRDATNNLIPITNHPKNAFDISEDIMTVFQNDFNINPEDLKMLRFIINEMICNTTIHSNAESGAFFYFQKYPQRGDMQFILVDNGIGVLNSLKRNLDYINLTNSEAVQKAFEFEVTCGEGRGHGLYTLQEIIKKINGSITLVSGKNTIFIDRNNFSISENEEWNGVYLEINFKFNTDFNLNSFFDEIGYTA